jgi:hypothetical protein
MTRFSNRTIEISELLARRSNPRTHSKKQIEQIAASIQKYGFTNPVLVDENNGIVAGHGRVEAAKLLQMTEVPTICLSGLSDAEIRAYVIADNKIAENAGWDRDLLALEFKYLADLNIDFDLTLTGFELPEIDALAAAVSLGGTGEDPADLIPALPSGPAITRPGDVWEIVGHRFVCGDSTQAETYTALLGEQKATMVFSDAPYNLRIDGHVSGLGKNRHREFAMASGEMSADEFTTFLTSVFGTSRASQSTARSTSNAWTLDIFVKFSTPAEWHILSSRIYASGRRAQAGWDRFTGRPMSSYSSSSLARRRTSTTCSSGKMADIGLTSGHIRVLTVSARPATKTWRCTRRSSQ